MKSLKHILIIKQIIAIFLLMGSLAVSAETLSVQMLGKAELIVSDDDADLAELLELDGMPTEVRDALLDIKTYCYRAPLRDTDSGLRVGTGYHCIAQIVHNCPPVIAPIRRADVFGDSALRPASDVHPDIIRDCPDVQFVEFIVFRFADGIIVAGTQTTIQKNLTGNTDKITHITGFFPKGNNIVFGTRRFRGIEGRVRLSGGVNLDNFPEVVGLNSLFQVKFRQ